MTEIGPVNIQMTASGISEVISAFKNVEDRVAAFERKMEQLANNGSRKRVKLSKDEAQAKGEAVKREASDTEKAEQDKTKAAEKWAKARERIVHNSAMMAGRLAKQQADTEIKEAERSANARARFSQQMAGKIVNNFRTMLGHATRIFGALTALGGGMTVGNAFSEEMKVSKSAMALEIASDVPGKPKQRISAADATAKARQMGLEYGVSTTDVLETQHAIIAKTGRGAESARLTEAAMKIGTAEGVDPKELGQAVASAMAQNPKLTVTEGINLMKMMVDQGKAGAIEIKDMAKILPVLTKTSALYGGNQSDAQARLVTMVQTAIKTTGGPEQAAVAVSRFGDWVSSKKGAKALGGKGFDVFGKDGQLKPIEELMEGVLMHGGNTAKGLGAMGMEGKAKSLVEAFAPTYNEALKKGATPQAAAREATKEYREELAMRATDAKIEHDLKKVQGTDAFQVQKAMKELEMEVALKLVPHLKDAVIKLGKLAPEIGKVLDSLGRWISWAVNNPWSAIGIAAAAAVTKSIAAEILASGLKSIIAKLFGGASPAGGVPGGGGGSLKAGAAGAAAAVSISGAIQGFDIMLGGDPGVKADEIVRQAKKGNAEAKAKIAEVQEEGTGVGGDLKRFGKGMAATLFMGLGSQSGKEWYESIGTRQHLSEQLQDPELVKQIEAAKAEAKKVEANTSATDRNTAAVNNLAAKLDASTTEDDETKKKKKPIRGPGGNL